MAVKKFKATSAGRRFMAVSDFAEITRSKPERSLLALGTVDPGMRLYSAESHPDPFPASHFGTSFSMDTAHNTRVFPVAISALPSR